MSKTKSDLITFEELKNLFHLAIAEAAEELGICETMLKKRCRNLGIKRWPQKKINSINNIIHYKKIDLENSKNELEKDNLLREINELKEKQLMIFNNPSIELKELISFNIIKEVSRKKLRQQKKLQKQKKIFYKIKIEKYKSQSLNKRKRRDYKKKILESPFNSYRAILPSISILLTKNFSFDKEDLILAPIF